MELCDVGLHFPILPFIPFVDWAAFGVCLTLYTL